MPELHPAITHSLSSLQQNFSLHFTLSSFLDCTWVLKNAKRCDNPAQHNCISRLHSINSRLRANQVSSDPWENFRFLLVRRPWNMSMNERLVCRFEAVELLNEITGAGSRNKSSDKFYFIWVRRLSRWIRMTGNELRTLSVKREVNHIRFGFPRVFDQRLIESADGQHSWSNTWSNNAIKIYPLKSSSLRLKIAKSQAMHLKCWCLNSTTLSKWKILIHF